MLKKLYAKSEMRFEIMWIVAYVVLASAGDNLSAGMLCMSHWRPMDRKIAVAEYGGIV